jgi:hypothetical protein
VCQAGYNGSNCENDIDECALYQPCNKTGEESCKDGINNYTCICNPGFTGTVIKYIILHYTKILMVCMMYILY